MKKFLVFMLTILMILCTTNSGVFAEESSQSIESFGQTDEPSIPIGQLSFRGKDDLYTTSESLNEKRKEWLNQVVTYNEKYYNQNVEKVVEDNEKYVLYFEPKEMNDNYTINEKDLVGVEKIEIDDWGVYKIEYIKPESVNLKTDYQTNSSVTVGGTTYDYKLTYYYAWSNGYYRIAKTSWTSYLEIGASVLMAFTNVTNILVSVVIDRALASAFSAMDQGKPITAETYNKYFYMNKVCSVKPSNSSTWYPTCQIGLRDSFGWCWSTYQKSTGEPILAKQPNPKQANGTPPTNYDSMEKKPHYDDTNWMINKAIEKINQGGYADVYATCTTKV